MLNGQGTDKEYTSTVRRVSAIFLAITVALVGTSCGNSLQTLRGTLYFQNYGSPDKCAYSVGETGTVKSGEGEILGTIRVESVESSKAIPSSFDVKRYECVVNLEALEIDLSVNVIQIEITSQEMGVAASWILNKSDFSNGEIALNAA